MNFYGAKDLARQFRTVRANTIKIAEEISESNYGFQPSQDVRSVARLLTHIALSARFSLHFHGEHRGMQLAEFDYPGFVAALAAEEQKERTKDETIAFLKSEGEKFASLLESLDDSVLGELIEMPAGGDPPKTRFEMLMGVKEHEMHHRGQLMLILRLLGQVPPLTRTNQERIAAILAARQK